jgi:membrane-associated protein
MHAIIDFLKSLYNAERLLELARALLSSPLGIAGLFGIIFSETGLLVGFFLPGDSLLFSVGFASGASGVNLYLLAGLLMCAAIIGDNVGYFLGKHSGPRIFKRPKSRFFHPDHLKRTKKFYEKYGARAIVYARFIPIIRTCTPFVSGVAEMPYPRFLFFSLFGGTMWIAFMMTIGYKLGQVPIVRRNFEKAILAVIFCRCSRCSWKPSKPGAGDLSRVRSDMRHL